MLRRYLHPWITVLGVNGDDSDAGGPRSTPMGVRHNWGNLAFGRREDISHNKS